MITPIGEKDLQIHLAYTALKAGLVNKEEFMDALAHICEDQDLIEEYAYLVHNYN
jgi:hypothetical protein